MRFRRVRSILTWSLLFAIGCGSGQAGCGGCDGCGGGSEPIPGGFDAAKRTANGITAELSPRAFDFVEEQVAVLVAQQAGGLSQAVPCTQSQQQIEVQVLPRPLPPFRGTIDIFACDLNDDSACTPADDDPSMRVDEPGHGVRCEVAVNIAGTSITPTQNANGTVDVSLQVDLLVKTGRIPLTVSNSTLGGIDCIVEFDSDKAPPNTIPVRAVLRFSIDPATGDLLTFDLAQMDDIADAIDSDELSIDPAGSGNTDRLVCDALGNDFLKEQLFGQLGGPIEDELRAQIDSFRCRACEPTTNACPGGATCDEGICWYDRNAGRCPPPLLGIEGRNRLALMGPEAVLDLSILAGGKNADGKPSHHAQAGALTLGVMAGSDAPFPAACVPPHRWAPRPVPPQPDFKAESLVPATDGTSLADYALGLGVSDTFLDRTMHDAYHAGMICLDVDGGATGFLSTGLFSTFLPSLSLVTDGEDRPMLISVRPRRPPHAIIGRGTVKPGPDGTQVPDDALITLAMEELQLDFYALLEDRQVRLFSLFGDVRLPLSLEFDPVANTVLPVIGDLGSLFSNVTAGNSEILAEDPAALGQLIGSLVGLASGPLADALQPIELPTDTGGISVRIRDARGVIARQNGDGHEHLALFAALESAPAPPVVAQVDTRAELVDFHVPTLDGIKAGEKVRLDVRAFASSLTGRRAEYEYAWRVDGGFWSPWQRSAVLHVNAATLAIQGTHLVEVRARHAGVPASADTTPAVLEMPVDYEAPRVRLELAAGTRDVTTHAYDPGTDATKLTFRYRLADGSWTSPGPARAYPLASLGDLPFLEVEVTDPAGHVSRARFGTIDVAVDDPRPVVMDGGGCASAGLSLLALAGLLGRRRRR